jgi:hypothetical protein
MELMELVIKMKTKSCVKKEGTKNGWIGLPKSEDYEIIDEATYKRIEDSIGFFKGLGGSESVTRTYTVAGFRMSRLVSTSPDRKNRTIREFTYSYK